MASADFVNLKNSSDWGRVLTGWTVEPHAPNQMLYTFKTERARLLVSWVEVDFEAEGLSELYEQNDFKEQILSDIQNELNDWHDGDFKSNYSSQTIKNNTVLDVISRFTSDGEYNLFVERFFFYKGNFWHLTFTEQSENPIADDSYKKSFDVMYRALVETVVVAQTDSASRDIASTPYRDETSATGPGGQRAPRVKAVGAITPACLKSGYEEKYLRRGPPTFSVSLSTLGSACKSKLKNMKDNVVNSARAAYSSLWDPPQFTVRDYPECRKLRLPGIKGDYVITTKKQFSDRVSAGSPLNKWVNCSLDQQYVYGPARQVWNAVKNPQTYKTLYKEARKNSKYILGLAYLATPGGIASVVNRATASDSAGKALRAAAEYAREGISNIGCLNDQTQAELVCSYGAGAVAAAGALGCTLATRGRCVAILKARLKDLKDKILSRFKMKKADIDEALEPVPVRSAAEKLAVEAAEKRSLAMAADLEKRGLVKSRKGFPCGNLTKIYPNSFPSESKNCVAIRAKKDLDDVICGCGKVGKSSFNFSFPCPKDKSKFYGVKDYSDEFSLPADSQLDFCSRITIPKGKECYMGSTVAANDGVLKGIGGGVQIFCLDGAISDRVKAKIGPKGLQGLDMTAANPAQRLVPKRWSPFSNFREFDDVIRVASTECKTGCSADKFKEIYELYEQAVGRARRSSAYSKSRLDRLYREEKIFDAYIKELRDGRNGTPGITLK